MEQVYVHASQAEHDKYKAYPATEESKRNVLGKEVSFLRQSGFVRANDERQHSATYSKRNISGDVGIRTDNWETSSLRLQATDGTQTQIELDFSASVQPGDFVSVIGIVNEKKNSAYNFAVQNHSIGNYYKTEFDLKHLKGTKLAPFARWICGWGSLVLIILLDYLIVTYMSSPGTPIYITTQWMAVGWIPALFITFGIMIVANYYPVRRVDVAVEEVAGDLELWK